MRPLPNRRPSAPGAARRLAVGMAGPDAVDAAVDSRLRGNDGEIGGGKDGLNSVGKDALGGYWKEGLWIAGRGVVDAAVDSRFRGNDEERGGGNDGYEDGGLGRGRIAAAGVPGWRRRYGGLTAAGQAQRPGG